LLSYLHHLLINHHHHRRYHFTKQFQCQYRQYRQKKTPTWRITSPLPTN
jgi:hypothetical protein